MQTMTITVAAIEWPAAGKKLGAIIDSTGKRWGVWPDKLPGYQQGCTYEVGYETATPVGNGGAPGLILPRPPTPESRSAPSDDQRRMDIFICGAFNNILSNPNFTSEGLKVEGLAAVVEILRRVWQRTLGPQAQEIKPKGALNKDLDDEIPFE